MDYFKKIMDNKYVTIILTLFLFLYGYTLSRVALPNYIKNLFNNNIFRIVFLSLLLIYNFDKSPHVALAVSIVFVLTLYYIGEREMKENFAYLEAYANKKRNDV
uniref:Uncharacterized protein n=1 Tax=Mimivirus LCMiAC01 TaxID=2506608 RepID=A0A481Z104_9VIRU|nr:MAG: hypothetical protein LCMiAC01_00200 [Mimivirus LCMiAC01]